MKTMIKRIAGFLKVGQIPMALRNELDAEGGPLWLEEGIPVTAILGRFKTWGIHWRSYTFYRRMAFIGFVAKGILHSL